LYVVKYFESGEQRIMENMRAVDSTIRTTVTVSTIEKALNSAFKFFSTEKRQSIKDVNPGMSVVNVCQELATLWKSLSEEGKKPYEEKSKESIPRKIITLDSVFSRPDSSRYEEDRKERYEELKRLKVDKVDCSELNRVCSIHGQHKKERKERKERYEELERIKISYVKVSTDEIERVCRMYIMYYKHWASMYYKHLSESATRNYKSGYNSGEDYGILVGHRTGFREGYLIGLNKEKTCGDSGGVTQRGYKCCRTKFLGRDGRCTDH
jgi:hypothetical protein